MAALLCADDGAWAWMWFQFFPSLLVVGMVALVACGWPVSGCKFQKKCAEYANKNGGEIGETVVESLQGECKKTCNARWDMRRLVVFATVILAVLLHRLDRMAEICRYSPAASKMAGGTKGNGTALWNPS